MIKHRRLIIELLNALKSEGYPLGPGKLMQVEEIIRNLPPNTPPEALRTFLSPIFSSSPEGQRQFSFLFDAQLKKVDDSLNQEEPDIEERQEAKTVETRFRRLFLGILLVSVIFFGFILDLNTHVTLILITSALIVSTLAGWKFILHQRNRLIYIGLLPLLAFSGYIIKTQIIRPVIEPKSFSRIERFTIPQGETIKRNIQSPGDTATLISCASLTGETTGETPSGSSFSVIVSKRILSYTADPEAIQGISDSIFIEAVYANRRDTITFIAEIIERIQSVPIDKPNIIQNVSIPYPRSIAEIEVLPVEIDRANFYSKYQWVIRAVIFLLTALALYTFIQWNEKRRAQFVAEITQSDRPPYTWNIELGEPPRIQFEDSFIQIINRLRKREGADNHRIDVRATVKAASKLGGQTSLVYRQLTRPPEYLLLIDRLNSNDHRARYFNTLYQELLRVEVPVERFFFNGDPRICFNENHISGQLLNELYHKHRDARLIILGDGGRLLHPITGQLASWTSIFNGWRRRAIMLPNIPQRLGYREEVLGSLFVVAPASNQGLDLVLEQFESLEKHKNLEKLRSISNNNTVSFEFKGGLLDRFRRAGFSTDVINWICACAVYPTLHWDLTLYLGRFLSNPNGPSLLTESNIRKIVSVPWFIHGKIPENARIKLIEYLAGNNLEIGVRKAIDDLLKSTPIPIEGSVARDKYRMNIILNELLLNPEPSRKRNLEQEFEFYLAAGKQPDFVSFKKLNGSPTRLDFIVPDNWKKFLFKHTSSRFGFHNYALFSILLFFAGLLIALTPIKTTYCDGESVMYKNRILCLNTPEDRLLYLEYSIEDAIESRNYYKVDSLLSEAGRIARFATPHLDTSPIYYNTATRYYNNGAEYINCLYQKQIGCSTFPSDSLQNWACEHFKRGNALHNLLADEQDIKFFNAINTHCPGSITPISTFFAIKGSVKDSKTGLAINAATLTFQNAEISSGAQSTEILYKATTDNAGRYILEQVAANTTIFQITVKANGYRTKNFRIRPQGEMPLIQLIKDNSPNPQPIAMKGDLEAVIETNSFTAINSFINGPYKENPLVADAISHRNKMEQSERTDFVSAQNSSNPSAYENFLSKWPDGPNAQDARLQLELVKNPQKALESNMVFVAGGTLIMGCKDFIRDGECDPDENPWQTVQIRSFFIGRFEVTQAQWRAVMGSDPRQLQFKGCDNCPVEHVSWKDTKDFLKKLNSVTGKNYRLPSEAEWEFAARGGIQTQSFMYSGSNIPDEVAWYSSNKSGARKTHPVGQKTSNELNLYDMSGNVWEWCEDDWHNSYKGLPKNGSPWISSPRSVSRVLRGGAWDYSIKHLRNSNRNGFDPVSRDYNVGFRLALDYVN